MAQTEQGQTGVCLAGVGKVRIKLKLPLSVRKPVLHGECGSEVLQLQCNSISSKSNKGCYVVLFGVQAYMLLLLRLLTSWLSCRQQVRSCGIWCFAYRVQWSFSKPFC